MNPDHDQCETVAESIYQSIDEDSWGRRVHPEAVSPTFYSQSDNIIKCPHCGGCAEIVGNRSFRIICKSCKIRTLHYTSPDIARAVWDGKCCNEFMYRSGRP